MAKATTSFDRALALLDDPSRRRQALPRSDYNEVGGGDGTTTSRNRRNESLGIADLALPTSPPRRRIRTSQASLSSTSGSPLKDYLKRHFVDLSESDSMTPTRASSSTETGPRATSSRSDAEASPAPASTKQVPTQTFVQDSFLDDQTIETAGMASLYISPRRPLRTSIFESSTRIPTTSATPPSSIRQRHRPSTQERPRQTSATLRYALQHTHQLHPERHANKRADDDPHNHDHDQDNNHDDDHHDDDDDDDNERMECEQAGNNTSFLDNESDPPTELDERFPAINPAPTPRARTTDPVVQPTPQAADDIWRETESDYRFPRSAPPSTPPELTSIKGIDVEQLRSYVQGRSGEADDRRQDVDPVTTPVPRSAPLGWVSKSGAATGTMDMPLSRHDLEDAVSGLKNELQAMRDQMDKMVKAMERGAIHPAIEVRGRPILTSNVIEAFTTIDALVHHTSPNHRPVDQVMAADNIDEITRRVRDWEAVVRSRSTATTTNTTSLTGPEGFLDGGHLEA